MTRSRFRAVDFNPRDFDFIGNRQRVESNFTILNARSLKVELKLDFNAVDVAERHLH